MESHCPYCKEIFSNTLNIPMILDCGHAICNNCIDILSIYKYPQTCPIDNIKTKFNNLIPCQKTLNYLQTLCPIHILEIQSLCTKHTTLLCESCEPSHLKCEKIKGNFNQINEELKIFIKKVKKKALDFSNILEKEKKTFTPDCLNWVYEECQEEINLLKSQKESLNEKSNFPDANLLQVLHQETENIKSKIFIKSQSDIEFYSNQIKNFLAIGGDLNKIYQDFGILGSSSTEKYYKLIQLMKGGKIRLNVPNINKLSKALQEIDMVRKTTNSIMFLANEICFNETNSEFAAYFSNASKNTWNVSGVGIGRPFDPSGFVFVNEMNIYYENEHFFFENINVQYAPDKISYAIKLERTFKFRPETEVMIMISISAIKHYMFCNPVLDDFVRVYDIDHNLLYGAFPILYLTLI
ncbi:hypothetical protein SteCoe_16047 [Stentor coeruleus]|uniref:RING-type domain-containing protein n=1 Tax=Stentor coeruleus TaxID=5963 RepID=A0A1R2C219_9CILI|nr:hypothetical protein SteCoe_16047 [Stentor coeruleus]